LEGDFPDVPKIVLHTKGFLHHPQDLLSSSQQGHRRAVILCLQRPVQNGLNHWGDFFLSDNRHRIKHYI